MSNILVLCHVILWTGHSVLFTILVLNLTFVRIRSQVKKNGYEYDEVWVYKQLFFLFKYVF